MSGVPIDYTLAICTHNHANELRATLADLESLEPPVGSWELLIVDNASTDSTAEVLRSLKVSIANSPARIVHEPQLGVAHARNRAIAEAKGSYVVFIDDDETPAANLLRVYEVLLARWQPDAVGGRIEVRFVGGERPMWLQDELLGFLGKLDYGPDVLRLDRRDTPIFTGNAAFKRSIVQGLGGFDTLLGRRGSQNSGGEDSDLYRRLIAAGHHVRWCRDAVIYHRISAKKMRRGYFWELHYRMGKAEGARKRSTGSRRPPAYLFGQLLRASRRAIWQIIRKGPNKSLRQEMNAAYFLGYVLGWVGKSS
jgi:glycosyltransferase involved in cell wall biosynthesis